MTRRLALVLTLGICAASLSPATALAANAPSSAAGNPFGVGLPQSSAQTPTQTLTTAPVVTTSSAAGSFSGTDALFVALGAAAILGGIAYFIWNDSRRHVRLLRRDGATAAGTPTGASRGSKAPTKSRKLKPAERRRRKRGRAR